MARTHDSENPVTAKPPTAPHLKGRWIRDSTRKAIYERDGYACQYCGKDLSTVPASERVLDHKDPRGGNDPENLVTACKECNDRKEGKNAVDFILSERKKALVPKKINLLQRLKAAKKAKAKPAKRKAKKPRKDALGIADAEAGKPKTVSRVNKKGTAKAKRQAKAKTPRRFSTKAAPDPRGFSKVSNIKKSAATLL